MRRLVLVALLLSLSQSSALAAWEGLLPKPGRCAGAEARSGGRASQERAMRCLVNYARSRRSLPPLAPSPTLRESARSKARMLVRCRQFSHTACGKPMVTVFRRAGYTRGSWAVGENLAWAGPSAGRAPRDIMRMWLYSKGHRENILSPRWREQSVALVDRQRFSGQASAEIWVSHFGRRG